MFKHKIMKLKIDNETVASLQERLDQNSQNGYILWFNRMVHLQNRYRLLEMHTTVRGGGR